MTNHQQTREHRKDQYCNQCPCKTRTSTPSPLAMDKVHSIQAKNAQQKKKSRKKNETVVDKKGESKSHCPWYINSAEHLYCFWIFAKQMTGPISDREICQLLGINQAQLREEYNNAIKKLESMDGDSRMNELVSVIEEKVQSDRGMNIYVDKEGADIETISEEMESELDIMAEMEQIKKKRKGRSVTGQPKHRDGKKTDIYFGKKKNASKK